MTESIAIKSTFKHALIYSGSNIIGKAVGFIMLPVYANFLRGEGYGILGMIDVVLSFMTLFIGHGISGAMTRFYFQRDSEDERNCFISTNLLIMLILVFIVSSPALILNGLIAKLAFGTSDLNYDYYITIAVLTFIADMSGSNAKNYLIIRKKSILFSAASILKLGLTLILNIYLIVFLKLGVLGYLYSGLISGVIFSLFYHLYVFISVGFYFKKDDCLDILKFSLPMLPGFIAMFIRNNVNRVIIRTNMGLSELGAFEMLFKFATLIGILITDPFGKSWGVKRLEICEKPEGPSTIARVYTLQLSLMLFIGLILSLQIPIILRILTPAEFWLGGYLAFFAVLSRIIMASYLHFVFPLIYAKVTYKISIIQFASAVLSIPVNYFLIRYYGLIGAIFGSCILGLFQCLIAHIFARKYYHIPFETINIVKLLIITVFLFFIINSISFSKTDYGIILDRIFKTSILGLIEFFHLDNIRNGKIIISVTKNIPLIIDAMTKFLLSLIFIPSIFLSGIIPKEILLKYFNLNMLRYPFFNSRKNGFKI
jgi:O-antigen/teichoic acid export membrane protein